MSGKHLPEKRKTPIGPIHIVFLQGPTQPPFPFLQLVRQKPLLGNRDKWPAPKCQQFYESLELLKKIGDLWDGQGPVSRGLKK